MHGTLRGQLFTFSIFHLLAIYKWTVDRIVNSSSRPSLMLQCSRFPTVFILLKSFAE